MSASLCVSRPARPFLQRLPQPQTRRHRAFSVTAYLTKHGEPQLQRSVEEFVAAVNKRDPDLLLEHLSPKVVWSDRVWSRDDAVGHKKVRKVHAELFTAMPDYHMHTDEVLARPDSNTVAVHFTATGTNTGEWRGRAPSGRRSTYSGVSLFIFDSESDVLIREVITYRQATAEERGQYLRQEHSG